MTSIPKPIKLPDWANDLNFLSGNWAGFPTKVEPPQSQKDQGWLPKQKPPAEFLNYWQQLVFKWIEYLDKYVDESGTEYLEPFAQAVPDLTLDVTAGVFSFGEKAISFAGGSSPAFDPSAIPVGESRIDVLHVDETGTLQILEGVSGVAPEVPDSTFLMAIAEVTLTDGMTAITASDFLDVRTINHIEKVNLNSLYLYSDVLGDDGYDLWPTQGLLPQRLRVAFLASGSEYDFLTWTPAFDLVNGSRFTELDVRKSITSSALPLGNPIGRTYRMRGHDLLGQYASIFPRVDGFLIFGSIVLDELLFGKTLTVSGESYLTSSVPVDTIASLTVALFKYDETVKQKLIRVTSNTEANLPPLPSGTTVVNQYDLQTLIEERQYFIGAGLTYTGTNNGNVNLNIREHTGIKIS